MIYQPSGECFVALSAYQHTAGRLSSHGHTQGCGSTNVKGVAGYMMRRQVRNSHRPTQQYVRPNSSQKFLVHSIIADHHWAMRGCEQELTRLGAVFSMNKARAQARRPGAQLGLVCIHGRSSPLVCSHQPSMISNVCDAAVSGDEAIAYWVRVLLAASRRTPGHARLALRSHGSYL
jgi:hypothetical protein